MNLAILCGHLGADPEVRKAGDKSVCSFGIATTRKYKDNAEREVEDTTWHRVQVWGPMGRACAEHLKKGRQVLVRGRIRNTEWEKEGVKHKGTEIVAESVQFLGAKPGKKEEDNSGGKDNW